MPAGPAAVARNPLLSLASMRYSTCGGGAVGGAEALGGARTIPVTASGGLSQNTLFSRNPG